MNDKMSPQERKLRVARAQIVHAHPFFGVLLLKQKVVMTDSVATMATNGTELFANPEFVDSLPMPQLRAVNAHEALHPAFCHHTRRGDRKPDVWNIACDYAINPILIDAGLDLPEGALYSNELRGLSAEQIYARLMQEQQQEPEQDGDDGNASERDESDDQAESEQSDGSDEIGPENGGESATGDSGDIVPDYGNCGAVLDSPAESAEEKATEEREWRVTLAEAAQAQAMNAGTIDGDLQRMIDATLEPQADWRELLRRFIDQFARSDYSWQKQDRRYVSRGTYLPALHSEAMGPIALVVDASGSMPNDRLQQVGSELQAIVDEMEPERVDIIVHDTKVRAFESFEPGEEIELTAVAGGGTSFADAAAKLDLADDYVCAVWFTDLMCSDYGDEPNVPIVWLDYSNSERMPKYGDDVVRMPS